MRDELGRTIEWIFLSPNGMAAAVDNNTLIVSTSYGRLLFIAEELNSFIKRFRYVKPFLLNYLESEIVH